MDFAASLAWVQRTWDFRIGYSITLRSPPQQKKVFPLPFSAPTIVRSVILRVQRHVGFDADIYVRMSQCHDEVKADRAFHSNFLVRALASLGCDLFGCPVEGMSMVRTREKLGERHEQPTSSSSVPVDRKFDFDKELYRYQGSRSNEKPEISPGTDVDERQYTVL
ncbi:uncharacterized protein BT62DRAFT_931691 [Guyanagaster necrorhizus]|uniref:Uncharacterized protein n=1 Tax=Guyanagaster necrorhizus TaxID=856835 RepID=A0A9P7VUS4_9AGAR|nr:uncharacterized protein BT62DRAFT_931691 [Guyanagaster necrorhizus MCA 3950]KAG7446246.1 hypothetical protein BT62DRAFT_931691 [Guyanagaster necrorhizus MCA 3950]